MNIKTYVVSTLVEAVEKIKKEMGPNAIILSTRRVPSQRWWSKDPQVEVTAGIDPVYASGEDLGVAPQLQEVQEERLPAVRQQQVEEGELNPYGESILSLSRTLLWHRVHPSVVQDLAGHLIEKYTHLDAEQIREAAAQWLFSKLSTPEPYGNIKGAERLVAFMGPTGSGKTTTVVKLAAHLKQEKKKSVGLITLDHILIGGAEKLKKYASLLDIPCELAVTAHQFKRACEHFSQMDTILIDTPGASIHDQQILARVQQILPKDQPIWKFLVIPAYLQDPDLRQTLENYQADEKKRLILTKLDEASSFGSLFNASYLTSMPLSYFTTGQRVFNVGSRTPEDIEAATKERVMDCLLNFSGNFPIPDAGVGDSLGGAIA